VRAVRRPLALAALGALCLAVACGGGSSSEAPDASTPTPVPDAAPVAPPDAAPGALAACVDRPDELPRPPGTALPCDLLPPP
jgi:hypothetical protein